MSAPHDQVAVGHGHANVAHSFGRVLQAVVVVVGDVQTARGVLWRWLGSARLRLLEVENEEAHFCGDSPVFDEIAKLNLKIKAFLASSSGD